MQIEHFEIEVDIQAEADAIVDRFLKLMEEERFIEKDDLGTWLKFLKLINKEATRVLNERYGQKNK